MPDRVARALALPRPGVAVGPVDAALRARRILMRYLPSRTQPVPLIEMSRDRSYPNGYRIDDLGPMPAACPVRHAE
ncbi:hypothetical protein [Nocardia sp. NPDC051570]|uniref:hypothetical protein n=1 Tax=Nocardia sp. NPDC051570 TaxID=3364324 RepID=UPI0037A6C0A4